MNKIETFTVSSNPFGEIAGGYISIRCQYTKFILQTPTPRSLYRCNTLLLHKFLPALEFWPDIDTGSSAGETEDNSTVVGCLVAHFKQINSFRIDPAWEGYELWILILKLLHPADAQQYARTNWRDHMSVEMAQSCYRRLGVVALKGRRDVAIGDLGEVANQYRDSLSNWDEMDFTII